ncbi:hypothetical protein AB0J82_20700 [Asanoa sp. NPDC049518]|uniref:hypothetical protein n=1 Tax=unclassified Asanoa TaxID=2685164 RepID=UPI00341DD68C
MSRTYPPEDRQLACLGVVPAHLRPVLVALLSGAPDTVASRRLNVSERTYSRRLAELLDFFDSRTRFQVGVQVGLSGWTTPAPDQLLRTGSGVALLVAATWPSFTEAAQPQVDADPVGR